MMMMRMSVSDVGEGFVLVDRRVIRLPRPSYYEAGTTADSICLAINT